MLLARGVDMYECVLCPVYVRPFIVNICFRVVCYSCSVSMTPKKGGTGSLRGGAAFK